MAYRDLGEGQAVVMVHGNPTWSYYYRLLVEALGDRPGGFRSLVPDHIGMGHSDRWQDPKQSYSLAQRIDDFDHWLQARLQEQADPTAPIDLVVHDWGGAIGLSWAARNPKLVRRIVILNTWAFNIPKEEGLPPLLKLARSGLGRWLTLRFNAFSRIAAKIAAKKPVDEKTRLAWMEPYEGAPERRYATWQFVKDIPLSPDDPSWEVLAKTETMLEGLADKPILLGWGMRDFVFTPKVLDMFTETFPNASVLAFDQAGHYVLEDEREELIPKIVAFLDS